MGTRVHERHYVGLVLGLMGGSIWDVVGVYLGLVLRSRVEFKRYLGLILGYIVDISYRG